MIFLKRKRAFNKGSFLFALKEVVMKLKYINFRFMFWNHIATFAVTRMRSCNDSLKDILIKMEEEKC